MKADWFGPRLRELRAEKGWTQQQLADAAGLAVGIVRKLEQRENKPTWETALALADALGVSCEAFTRPPAESPPARPGRPRKAPEEAEQPDQQRKRRGKGPGATGPVASTPATEQHAVPPTGGRPADELPPAQHKPKERRARRPKGK